jgi:hypothetical protein
VSPTLVNPANIMKESLRDIKAKQKFENAFPMLQNEAAESQTNE